MISLNKAMLIGNVTKDLELKYIPSGQAVLNFSIATNRRFKNTNGDLQEDAQFHDVVAWGKVAEIISQIVHKGNKIYIDGRLQTRQWDAPDGSKRYRTEIIIEQFVPLTPKSGTGFSAPNADLGSGTPAEKTAPGTKAKTNKTEEATALDDDINLDDIPF